MGARLIPENRRLFRSRRSRRARPVPAKVAERHRALDPVRLVAVIVVAIAQNVGEAEVLRMTRPVLRESRHCLTLSDLEASRTPAKENPVL